MHGEHESDQGPVRFPALFYPLFDIYIQDHWILLQDACRTHCLVQVQGRYRAIGGERRMWSLSVFYQHVEPQLIMTPDVWQDDRTQEHLYPSRDTEALHEILRRWKEQQSRGSSSKCNNVSQGGPIDEIRVASNMGSSPSLSQRPTETTIWTKIPLIWNL